MKIKSFFNLFAKFAQRFFRLIYSQDMQDMQELNVCFTHMKSFGEFRGINAGKDVIIIATGPTLNKFKPIENGIYIGVNKAFTKEICDFSYIFVQDYGATKGYIENILISKSKNAIKFYGVLPPQIFGNKYRKTTPAIMPESVILRHNARKYFLYTKESQHSFCFNTDIDKNYIQDCGSVALSAMQFALFTNPRRIYLVGCDCSSGYFDKTKGADLSYLIKPWKELKKFADIYYPETEIISVNPVGLKGVFTDLFQDEQ